MLNEQTSLRILADRAGTVREVTDFLHDLEKAYNTFYRFTDFIDEYDRHRFSRRRFFLLEFGIDYPFSPPEDLSSDLIIPENRLSISRISIQSPGFWEFVGSVNPVQQIREFLKNRYERQRDREWRDGSEREKARLTNDLLQRQVLETENKVIRGRVALFRDMGYSEEQIRELIWASLGKSLMDLGRHQDNGLINEPE